MLNGKVDTIPFECFAPNIKAFMTTKGVATDAMYGGANFGYNTNEPSASIKENYKLLLSKNSIQKLVTLKQTHSSICHVVTNDNYQRINGVEGDALFTKEANIAIGVLTADCYPVLIEGENSIAALHCGWKGTVGGIIESVADCFVKSGDTIKTAIVAAGIGSCCYEVQDDFVETVAKAGYNVDKYLSFVSDKSFFDLRSLVTDILSQVGVQKVYVQGMCTAHDEQFFSYRRDRGDTGRMLTTIMRCAGE